MTIPCLPTGKWRALIGASPLAGVDRRDGGWSLVVQLAAVRVSGTDVIEQYVRCELPMSHERVKAAMKRFEPYQVVDVGFVDTADRNRVLIDSIVPVNASDEILAGIAERLRQPVVVKHDVLGVLRLDRRAGTWSGTVTWCGRPVSLDLECDSADDPGAAARHAVRLLERPEEWQRQAEDRAAQRLLPLRNDHWRDGSEAPLAQDAFLARIVLESISVDEAGSISFWFDDGDLFLGHVIVVSGRVDAGFDRADIMG